MQTISGSPSLLLGPGQGLGFTRCPEWGCPGWRLSRQPWDGTAVTGERQREKTALGAWPLSAPQPPHLPEGGEQPPSSQRKKEPRSGMLGCPREWGLHVPVQMRVRVCSCLGTPLRRCADLTWAAGRSLLAQAGAHLIRNLQRQTCSTGSERADPAAVREAEPLSVGVPQPRRAEGPWQLRFQAAGRQRGFCKGDGKRNSIPPLVFLPPLC